MKLDIVFVTYNSEDWVDMCFESIIKSEYDLKELTIIAVDNNSSDKTIEKLNVVKEKHGEAFNDFKIIESNKNLGFGKGNNLGFSHGSSPFVFFLNIDTELEHNALNEIKLYIDNAGARDGLWELRQFPYEHPKNYNPVTLETTWSSGAAIVVRRDVFEEVNGFDEHIFMYAEDVDLSWRIRARGYKLKYAPRAVVHHYCYKKANEVKPNQFYNSTINNLLLRYRFGSLGDIIKGYAKYLMLIVRGGPLKGSRGRLFLEFIKHYGKIGPFLGWRFKNKIEANNFRAQFYSFDYEYLREGAFYINELPENCPRVSVIVRTCGRPEVLRETLITLRNQTYRNIEVVVVEDGENISEEMIKRDFWDLNLLYASTGEKAGRSRAGNMALEMATGKYVNFLDDDDVFFPDHVEVLVRQLEKNYSCRAAYSIAFETPIEIKSRSPYVYELKAHNIVHKQPFNRILLFHHNYIPIQSIMFERDIYLEEGGIDENLEVLEDWDLWVRYACNNDFLYVEKLTSKYRTPSDRGKEEERQKLFDDALIVLREKHKTYSSRVNVSQTAEDIQEIYNSFVVALTREHYEKLIRKRPFIMKFIFKSMGLARRIFKRF